MRKLAILSLAFLFLMAMTTSAAQANHRYNPPKKIKKALQKTFHGQWKIASKVAYCESRFNIKAKGGSSLGLMQIDAPNGYRIISGRYFSKKRLLTLKGNLRAAQLLWIDGGRHFYHHWKWSYWCWSFLI